MKIAWQIVSRLVVGIAGYFALLALMFCLPVLILLLIGSCVMDPQPRRRVVYMKR